MGRLVIIGAGGHGRVIADAAEAGCRAQSIVFLDDRYPALSAAGSWPVLGRVDSAASLIDRDADVAIVAIGQASVRMRILDTLQQGGLELASVVHPSASVSRHALIGAGSVVLAGACVNIGSVLGRGVIVNTGATVDHDCSLGDGVHIAPGAHLGGNVTVGPASWIGIGASVRHGVTIGAETLVGAGAAVVSNISNGAIAIGVPARERARA